MNIFKKKKNCSIDRTIPSLLLITLPKSGSIYIASWLLKEFDYKQTWLSSGCFPDDTYIFRELKDVSQGGMLSQDHVGPSSLNVSYIQNFNIKAAIHIRDPRDSLVSWIYYCIKNIKANKGFDLRRSAPRPSCELFDRPIKEIIDWHIENYLPIQCGWIHGWLTIAKQRGFLVTSFTRLVEEPESFLRDYASFIGRPAKTANIPIKEQGEHFRVGKSGQWDTEFSKTQKQRANEIIESFNLSQGDFSKFLK
jgi:hypothetical protein